MKGLKENDMREDKKVFHENGKSFSLCSALYSADSIRVCLKILSLKTIKG